MPRVTGFRRRAQSSGPMSRLRRATTCMAMSPRRLSISWISSPGIAPPAYRCARDHGSGLVDAGAGAEDRREAGRCLGAGAGSVARERTSTEDEPAKSLYLKLPEHDAVPGYLGCQPDGRLCLGRRAARHGLCRRHGSGQGGGGKGHVCHCPILLGRARGFPLWPCYGTACGHARHRRAHRDTADHSGGFRRQPDRWWGG